MPDISSFFHQRDFPILSLQKLLMTILVSVMLAPNKDGISYDFISAPAL